MISFKSFLAESRSAPLYHGTRFTALDSILLKEVGIEPRTFQLGTKLGYPKDYSTEIQGISATRKFSFAVYYRKGPVLELDQRKLDQRFKIVPFQYWQESGYLSGARMSLSSPSPNEYEEFIITRKPIKLEYITRLYIPQKTTHFQNEVVEEIRQKFGSSFIRTY